LSTTTGCPQLSLIFWPIMRVSMSGWLPGEVDTTTRIGLLG
jgi:hypothetical protein